MESLEDRLVLATFTVSNFDDDGPGTLRQAIIDANAASGADDIEFSVTGTINTTSALPTITDAVTITGPENGRVTISAGLFADDNLGNGDTHRIFNIDDGDSENQINVEISNLELTGADIFGLGGAIYNDENLTLRRSTLSGNAADSGGAVLNDGTITIENSTLSGNFGYINGGGLFNSGTAVVSSSTITQNAAGSFYLGYDLGGGVYNEGSATLTNTIISGNRRSNGVADNLFSPGSVDGDFNLLGPGARNSIGPNDIYNYSNFPRLALLADNGGVTRTHGILPGSPALNAGDNTGAADFDQRGAPFTRIVDGQIDIGAVEARDGINGVLDDSEYPDPPVAVQDTPTGFGDEDGDLQRGSELNAAYSKMLPDGSLQLLLTGNLERNGNGIILFFDTRSGGAVENVLSGGYGELGTFGGQRVDDWGTDTNPEEDNEPLPGDGIFATPGGPSVLGPDFDPDFAIEFNAVGGEQYVNLIDMTVDGNSPSLVNRDVYLGSAPYESSGIVQDYFRDEGQTYAGTLTHAFLNANFVGVQPYDELTPAPQLTAEDPTTAVMGLELVLSPELIGGDPGQDIKVFAFITSASGEFLSNQMLPGIGGAANPGFAGLDEVGLPDDSPLYDARDYAGPYFFVAGATPVASGDFDDDGDVDGSDFLAWQIGAGTASGATRGDGDSNGDGDVDLDDLAVWTGAYGQSESPLVGNEEIEGGGDGGSDALVDAAMALEGMRDEDVDLAPSLATAKPTAAWDNADAALALLASTVSPSASVDVEDGDPVEADDLPWLADELLQRVFG